MLQVHFSFACRTIKTFDLIIMESNFKCILYWVLLVICMVLHFNYHIGGIFYGIDIVRPDSDGTVPIYTHMIRSVFYHLPIVWVIVILNVTLKWVRLALFIISIIYTASHAIHLVGEVISAPDISQVSLLSLTLLLSILLNIEHFKYQKEVID